MGVSSATMTLSLCPSCGQHIPLASRDSSCPRCVSKKPAGRVSNLGVRGGLLAGLLAVSACGADAAEAPEAEANQTGSEVVTNAEAVVEAAPEEVTEAAQNIGSEATAVAEEGVAAAEDGVEDGAAEAAGAGEETTEEASDTATNVVEQTPVMPARPRYGGPSFRRD